MLSIKPEWDKNTGYSSEIRSTTTNTEGFKIGCNFFTK